MPIVGHILIAEGNPSIARLAGDALKAEGYRVETASDKEAALQTLRRQRIQVVIFDPELPGSSGLRTVEELRSSTRYPEIIVVARSQSIEDATAAMRCGASDYLSWPWRPETLLCSVGRATHQAHLRKENAVLRQRVAEQPFAGPVVSESRRAQEVLRKIHAVAPSEAPVLFTGETGTGKGLMAKVLYSLSRRCQEPFLQVNCGALHEQLMESELFGHRKGSFSGATENKIGLFEIADGGTLFLDEIGELPLTTQAKLLQVLDTKEFRPVGDTHVRHVDVRIVAATNRDLQAEAADGRFRRDLFFRLNAVHIVLPPLRERREDLRLLLDLYLDRFKSLRFGRLSFSEEALSFLERYSWPGNVRELANVVEYSVLLARTVTIGLEDLPNRPTELAAPSAPNRSPEPPAPLAEVERAHVLHTLEYTHGQKAAAARLLGIDVKTLGRKLLQAETAHDPEN